MSIQHGLSFQDALSQELLEKYNIRGPRYTSYPTAPVWNESFGPEAYQEAIVRTNQSTEVLSPLSLYVHLPFCESRCLFCSCNVIITKQREHAETYLGYLFKEIEMAAQRIHPQRQVVQLHWGGGTPTYLSTQQIERLFTFQAERFTFAPNAEIGIEVDPRVTTPEQIQLLKDLGFNRISLGVQDFNEQVQETVRRIQPAQMTENLVNQARSLGFDSINFDLIYGLPHQTEDSFRRTLEDVIRISPDRIALYNYAYMPWISHHQKLIPEASLPTGPEKFRIFRMAIQRLSEAGYLYIGMDHFAKPQDELSQALAHGNLHRNFMGYTVQKGSAVQSADSDLYGFGVSAISGINRYYAQNHKKLSTYYSLLDEGRLPTHRGYALSTEDLLRRRIILAILCQGDVDYAIIEDEFQIDFGHHFADALKKLEGLTADGFLNQTDSGFSVTPLGRIFSRNVAMAFDAYLGSQSQQGKQFSKTL